MVIEADGPPCQGTCPNRGCVETLASGTALARDARVMAEANPGSRLAEIMAAGEPLDGPKIIGAAKDGDEIALAAVNRIADRLGVALASYANIFEPDMFVLGGGVTSAAGDLLLEPARAVLAARALKPQNVTPVVQAELGWQAGFVGAATLALDEGRA
jgi:glucokinase